MGKSARILGQEYDLTAQEMNQLLKSQGFLDGEPGEYFVTEKGAQYATETDFHRGTGGYSRYNRDWTQRTWDESIKDVLDTSPRKCQAAQDAVAEARRQRQNRNNIEQAKAESILYASYNNTPVDERSFNMTSHSQDSDDSLRELGKALLTIVVSAVTAYAICEVATRAKTWWQNTAKGKISKEKRTK